MKQAFDGSVLGSLDDTETGFQTKQGLTRFSTKVGNGLYDGSGAIRISLDDLYSGRYRGDGRLRGSSKIGNGIYDSTGAMRLKLTGVASEAETEALVARFTTPPTNARKTLINDAIKRLKTTVAFQKLDYLRLIAAETEQAGQRNWLADAFNASPVNSPTFTADRGYAGDGSSSYLSENFIPGDGGTYKYKQNDCYWAVWTDTAGQSSVSEAGSLEAAKVSLSLRNASNQVAVRAQSATNSTTTATTMDARGLTSFARNGAATARVSRNGVLFEALASTSAAVPTQTFALGRYSSGSFSTRRWCASMAGSYLTEAEELAIYNAILPYLQPIGVA